MKEDKKYFIDTNIFLRVLVKEDEKSFIDCVNFLEKIKNGKAKGYTSSLVLAEINWVLMSFYKFPKDRVIEALEGVMALKGLKIIDKGDITLAVKLYRQNKIKFIDAMIASLDIVANKSVTIVSYDKDFEKLDVFVICP